MMRTMLGLLLVPFFWLAPAHAHEIRPAYLELTEQADGIYDVLWKQPVNRGRRLALDPILPRACRETVGRRGETIGTSLITRWQVACDLRQGEIRVSGLGRTLTDVIVDVNYHDGRHVTQMLKPGAPVLSLSKNKGGTRNAAYLQLGIEHILFGFDHLMFIAGLVLLAKLRQLISVATAFTLAHSLTLGATALGFVRVPTAPVEIMIAVSIVLLAAEAVRAMRGQTSLAVRNPWILAFGFGLLHGFGFATALGGIGLPKGSELSALFLFNLGVEMGQVIFILALLAFAWLIRQAAPRRLSAVRVLTAYTIGALAMFWTLQRIAGTYFT